MDIEEIKENLKTNICDYIHKISYNLNIHFGYFQEWKTLFFNLINTKINNTNNIYPRTINMNVFSKKVKDIQRKYVITPIDKANNNFGFICKKFYAEILRSEIINSNTFTRSDIGYEDIRDSHCNTLKEYEITPHRYNIPFMYAIPKFHKIPTKFRYITSSVNCITKDISVILNLLLDRLSNEVETKADSCWIVKNNGKVLQSLTQCNDNPGMPGNHMIATFDFSTLYTTLPHDDLIRCLVALYNKYIHQDVIIHYQNKKLNISKIEFVNILKFCIRNSYILFDGNIYRQTIGIPMGANYSPNAANLYLHFYEAKFLNLNPLAGRIRYRHSHRYIDDL